MNSESSSLSLILQQYSSSQLRVKTSLFLNPRHFWPSHSLTSPSSGNTFVLYLQAMYRCQLLTSHPSANMIWAIVIVPLDCYSSTCNCLPTWQPERSFDSLSQVTSLLFHNPATALHLTQSKTQSLYEEIYNWTSHVPLWPHLLLIFPSCSLPSSYNALLPIYFSSLLLHNRIPKLSFVVTSVAL